MCAQKTITIVLVDTDRNVRSCYRSVLEKESDMRVIAETEDSELTVHLLSMLKPDVIVIDSDLVDLIGNHQLSQCIMKTPDIKMIVASFYSDSRFVIRMLHAGASGYILKDCAQEELVTAIRKVLANHTYISSGIAGIAKK
ncbi:response regulator transcription factor [bacterium]|nr:response regulator transcription factor [bacterium]